MTVTNESKNNATVTNESKSGSAWAYDQAGITYDGITDSISGMSVFYDGIGLVPTITNESKNNISVTNEAKNNV